MKIKQDDPQLPKPQVDKLAKQAAEALFDMQEADRDQVLGRLGGERSDLYKAVQNAAAVLDGHFLGLTKAAFEARIMLYERPSALAGKGGDRIAALKSALDETKTVGLEQATKAIAEIVRGAGATLEQIEQLVGRLERIRKLGDPLVRPSIKKNIARLETWNLTGLAAQVGDQLQTMAYTPLADHLKLPRG
jgi:hypothetical protein